MVKKKRRGFAAMDEKKQREIASKGGRAAHEQGTAHQFTPEEAKRAGQRGGEAVSRNREHMAAIGRKGGQASRGGRGRGEGGEEEDPDAATESAGESGSDPPAA